MNRRKCYLCGKPGLRRSTRTVEVMLDDGRTCRIPPAPHEYCPSCGERFYPPNALRAAAKKRRKARRAA